jgi:EAL domain-containing protein (putative c-di-GMP-specific phosphodiesterase class I)
MINRIRLQPLIKLSDNSIYGYEALCDKGDLTKYPDASQMLSNIIENCEGINKCKCHNFRLFINMTVEDIKDESFCDSFLKVIMNGQNINSENIVLEINENTSPGALSHAKKTLGTLRSHGVKIALDDFGTEYSDMFLMNELPIDIVKIDKKFIQSAPCNKNVRVLLKFVTQMSHDMGCEVIAEGIETSEQLACVTDLDADMGQGFLFAASVSSFKQNRTPFINLAEFGLYISQNITLHA